jgi:hypothetical protein
MFVRDAKSESIHGAHMTPTKIIVIIILSSAPANHHHHYPRHRPEPIIELPCYPPPCPQR